MNVLKRCHPVPVFIYFAVTFTVTAFSPHPILHLVSFAGAALYAAFILPGKKWLSRMALSLVLILVTAFVNPVFSHDGVTVLFFLQNNPVTLESIIFGVHLGVRIAAVTAWCMVFDSIFTGDKIYYLLSRVSHRAALLFTMTLRFIPLYAAEWKKLKDAQTALGLLPASGLFEKIRCRFAVFSALVTGSLERSVDTVIVLRSRGYPSRKRSAYDPVRFERKDVIFSLFALLFSAALIFFSFRDVAAFSFYPRMTEFTLSFENSQSHQITSKRSPHPLGVGLHL